MTRLQIKALITFLLLSTNSYALERVGRLGLGMSNQLQSGIQAISFKVQKSKRVAFGGLAGLDTGDNGGYGAGLKVYRLLIDEPQLNLYAAAMGALTSQKSKGASDQSGFQFDMSLGSEFSFVGLNSIGFSFEFGISLHKEEDFAITTTGQHIVVAGIHFYL